MDNAQGLQDKIRDSGGETESWLKKEEVSQIYATTRTS
jgi:hypothetical protein